MDSLVWAKMRFCSYWPAKVVETPPELGRTPRNKVCVLFMGTKQFGFVMLDKIENYIENRERFVKKGKGIDFRTAVQHMDEYISDNVKYRSHAYVKPKSRKIKTEQDIERQLGIKEEKSNCDGSYAGDNKQTGDGNSAIPVQSLTADSWAKEKKSLIDDLMALKSENQSLVQNLNDKNVELNVAVELKQGLEIRLNETESEFSAKYNELKRELKVSMDKEASSLKTISDLKRENALLQSQYKQLQSGLAQAEKTDAESDRENEDVYEVDKLLDDKLVSERHFLVRWKGYDETEDSWERESNLQCGHLLKKYKQSKKKH